MSVLRRRMFQQGGPVTAPEAAAVQQGAQQVMGQINQEIDTSQNFEQMINATRGEAAPIEDRYRELATIVGPEDAMQTPESVLALAQPVIENALVDEGIGGLAQEQMAGPVGPEMAGGIMEMTQPVQQFQEGGAARSLSDYYQANLPLIQEILGSGDVKKQAQGQALLDIAQRAFLFGSGVNPATGKPYGGDETEAQKFAGFLASSTAPIGEQLAAYNKVKQAEKLKALEMGIAQKSAAEAAASKTNILSPDQVLLDASGNVIGKAPKSAKTVKLANDDVWDITDPKNPNKIISGTAKEENIVVEGQIVNITNPKKPFVVFGDKKAVTETVNGAIIDISDPDNPRVIHRSDPEAKFETIDGNLINVTDPKNIEVVFKKNPETKFETVDGNLINVTDPKNIEVVFKKEKKSEFKTVNGALLNITNPDKVTVAYKDPKKDIRQVDGKLIDVTNPSNVEVLYSTPDVRYFQNKGQIWEIKDGALNQTFGEKDKDIRNIDNVLVDVSDTNNPKVLFTKNKDIIREHKGQLIRIVENQDNSIDVTPIFGEKDIKTQTIGRTVLDLTDTKNPQVIWSDEKEDIRNVNNNLIKLKDDGEYEVLYSDPSRELKEVNGQLIDVTPNQSGMVEPKIIFGSPPKDGENWYIPSTKQFVISFDKGDTFGRDKSQMPNEAIKVSSTIAFESAKQVALSADAIKERNYLFPKGKFNSQNFYSIRQPGSLNQGTITTAISGGQVNYTNGTTVNTKPVTGINANQVSGLVTAARTPFADAMEAADKGLGAQSGLLVAFDKYITGTIGLDAMVAPEAASAKQVLRSIIVLGRAAFVNNPRFPVYEMVQARELFPDPDFFFGSAAEGKIKLQKLKKLAVSRLENNLIAIESGHGGKDDVSAMVAQNIEIKNLLYLLQTVPYGTASKIPKNRYTFQTDE